MIRKGDYLQGAEAELRRRIETGSQDPDDYRNLAELQFAAGLCEEAIASYEEALNLSLTNYHRAKLSMELGWLFYEMGQRTKAESLAQTAIGLLSQEPESPEILVCHGSSQSLLTHCVWFRDEKSAADAAHLALQLLERATLEFPEYEGKTLAYIDAARLHNLLGNTEKSVPLCERCLKRELKEVDRLSCLIVYGEALRREERFTEAGQVIDEAFRYVKEYKGIMPGLYLELGLIQRFTDRLAEAQATFQQALIALESDPYLRNDAQLLENIHLNLAAVSYELGEYEKAAAAYKEALAHLSEDNPSHWNALLWLGHCYFETGAYSKARECYDQVLASPHSSDEEVADAREGLARLYYTLGQYREAAAAFEEVLRHYPTDDSHKANIMLWLGNCYEGTGDYGKARDYCEKVLASPHASDTDKISAQRGLARSIAEISYQSGKHGEAARAFEQALNYYAKDDPYRPKMLLSLGHCYLVTGDFRKASDCYEEVLVSSHVSEEEKDSARKNLGWSQGKLYYELGDYKNATAAFQEVLTYYARDDSYYSRTLVWLGYSYQVHGDIDKARDCYEEVLTLPQASADEKASAREGLARLPQLSRKTLH